MRFSQPINVALPHFGFAREQIRYGDVHHAIPVGMPQLRPELQNSPFYLYRIDPQSGERTGPWGTGFVIARAAKTDAPMAHHYAVTNWHVAVQLGATIIRFNTRGGEHRFVEKDIADWEFLPGGHDLAACDITADISEVDDILVHGEASFLTQALIDEYKIGIGEDAFMIGMFADNHGGARNVPAARFGNLSMLANDNAPVEIENRTRQPSHLVDMRSRGGFSGSPVFIYRTPYNNLSRPDMYRVGDKRTGFLLGSSGQASRKDWFVGLLGVHCSQFSERVEVRKAPQKHERLGDPITDGDVLWIQGGMTIVAPAWRITELLNLEVFEEMRNKREPDLQADRDARPRAESSESPAPRTNDANPTHREDFTRLVGAAARKPPQED